MSWLDDMDAYTGHDEWHDVYTIKLGELVEDGTFDWTRPELDWSAAAYDDGQYKRVCAYFIERFYWREISLLPIKQWFMMLHNKLANELMPKYKPMYARFAEGFAPLGIEDEYYKSRKIDSEYPETLLSGNSDYISSGHDEEWERIKEGEGVERYNAYMDSFQAIDTRLCDELEEFFTCMYTYAVNGF